MATHGHELQRTWELSPADVFSAAQRWMRDTAMTIRRPLIVAAALFAIGSVAILAFPLRQGFADRQAWTYVAAAFLFLMSTAAAAPALSTALRVARSHWRRPVNRVAEIWAVTLIVPFVLYLLLLPTFPGTEDRLSIWFGWPLSPWLWGALLMLALTGAGYLFAWFSGLPDLAVVRDHGAPAQRRLVAWLSRGWIGSHHQWRIYEKVVNNIGVLYVLIYVAAMTVLSTDFIISLIPGYFTAVFPAYFTITSFQAGIALTIVTMAVLRRWGNQADFFGREQFWALGKMLLAFSLLWFYFWWSEFIIFWYGRTPREVDILRFLMFETYLWPFVLSFAMNFALPLLLLMWNPIRRSITGSTVVAIIVLVGNLIDRVRLASAAFSQPDKALLGHAHALKEIPPAYIPGISDVLILVGMVAGALALVLWTVRLLPFPAIAEIVGGLRLRVHQPFQHTRVIVIGKPE
ncbi:MAG: hypothetical protein J7449_02245 [Thermomicrobium sp.]|uniref:NrfD/PsrC family molybdoenzyme membrane anchor subunit n=1 Tax=Thermomicrobium sp. TaxID=1969469 RepID=UPI001B128E73|nr:NrfD/PsrC family molybdoenzyme membrane anchor subunit [Thermomicrobium sp.]MBO9350282.1 hypothetical protein [Thermomicrobium sp.]